ncbi:LTA synthase family protein [Pyxidicoccus fallax]|uniref:LTA synthase family protein n=1 Tax=Pyxidicoccus fallax TaxID=394095 RepID=A0A848LXT5_9BACT|nr:LTA synthase family protein [Pyxidicoccus fallax]NMO22626.1 LTA synthase family protein [Pyxidicoccus fallax]NPC84718.1 LTA synthase family protein [Pyxidicoccus fallax]
MARRSLNPEALSSPRTRSVFWPCVAVILASAGLVAATELTIAAFSSAGLQGIHERNLWSMAISVGVITGVTGLLWTATNRLGVALALVASGLAFTSAVHIRKLQLINRPLLPWDFLEWRQVTSLAPTLFPGSGTVLAILGGLLVLSAVVALVRAVRRGRPRFPLPGLARAGLAAASLAYLLAITFFQHLPLVPKAFVRFGVFHQVWDQRSNFQINGLPLMMLWNWEGLRLEPGGAYSAEAVRSALGRDAEPPAPLPAEPVDVIVFMAESLWDPTQLGVRFSTDPLPFLRGLSATHSAGHLISPAFGGGTANAEFELLTGMSASFVPDGSFPYQHYVLKPVEALPSLFRSAGYRTAAIHPFHGWYWSRDVVYPLLGFDTFQALVDFADAKLEGPWVSDEAVVDRILQQLSDERQSQFVMAITMSTHGPYSLPLTGAEEVQVLSEMSPDNKLLLTNYAHKIRQTDRALERLVRALEKRPRRTLLVVFGDHLPMLGPNYSLYRETGFLKEPWTDAQRERMSEVPVVLWSNFALPKQDVHVSMGMFAPRILEAAGMKPHGFFAFLTDLARAVPVVKSDVLRSATNGYLPLSERDVAAPAPGSPAEWLRRYRLLTYDRLVGDSFSVLPRREAAPTSGPRLASDGK